MDENERTEKGGQVVGSITLGPASNRIEPLATKPPNAQNVAPGEETVLLDMILCVLEGRCMVCAWPLAEDATKGCVQGNCSFRPGEYTPEYSSWRRKTDLLNRAKKYWKPAAPKASPPANLEPLDLFCSAHGVPGCVECFAAPLSLPPVTVEAKNPAGSSQEPTENLVGSPAKPSGLANGNPFQELLALAHKNSETCSFTIVSSGELTCSECDAEFEFINWLTNVDVDFPNFCPMCGRRRNV